MPIPISKFIPPPLSSWVSICLFSMSLFLLCKLDHPYPFSRFHTYALMYDICFYDLLYSLCVTVFGFLHISARTWFCSLHGWVVSHCVYMYHIFFTHSSADGPLGCFHVLAIVNSAAMNIGVHVSFWTMVFSGYVPRNGIVESYSSSIFSFLGTSILFSIAAVSTYFPTNSVRELVLFTFSLAFIVCRLFWWKQQLFLKIQEYKI